MKKNIVFLFLLFFSMSFSQIKWMSIEEALATQANNPKKIVINFYSESSSPCKKMEKETYNHSLIAKYLNENFYAVKFNAEGKETINVMGRSFGNTNSTENNSLNEFSKFMNISTVPSTVFIDEENKIITVLQGNLTAKELEPYLLFIGNNDYKKIENSSKWENYQKKFKSKIKD